MGKVWRFTLENGSVTRGESTRKQLTLSGCNEPFKDRYWCPKKQWFYKAQCPFVNQRECENYRVMCGCL
jgi:hypothetical protein